MKKILLAVCLGWATAASGNWALFNATGPAPYIWAVFQSGTSGPLKLLQGSDGINWGNRASSYTPCNAGGYVRDPDVAWFASQGKFWLVHTNTTFGIANTTFDLASSSDGRTFTCVQQIDISAVSSGSNSQIWAPNFAHNADSSPWLDGGNCPHVYVSASNTGLSDTFFQIYEVHPTVCSDFSQAWSSPVVLTGTSLPVNYIDAYPYVSGATINLYYKNENTSFVEIMTTSTSTPTSGYVVAKSGNWAGWGGSLEGMSVISLGGSNVRIYLDALGSGIYHSESADNGTTWNTKTLVVAPFTFAHGTAILNPKIGN